jgi:hypothetical protein
MGYYHLLSAPAIDAGDDNFKVVPLALGRDQRLGVYICHGKTTMFVDIV